MRVGGFTTAGGGGEGGAVGGESSRPLHCEAGGTRRSVSSACAEGSPWSEPQPGSDSLCELGQDFFPSRPHFLYL